METKDIDFDWVEDKALELIRKVHVIGNDGIEYWAPAAGGYTSGCWTRDLAYMLMYGPKKAFDWNEVGRTLSRLLQLQTTDGAIPDKINVNPAQGSARAFYSVIGGHAAEDNPMFLVHAIDRYCTITGDIDFFTHHLEGLEKALHSVSRCPASGLVYIDPLCPHSGYGFCDIVDKRGHDLFCSLLWWNAANIMAERLEQIALSDRAKCWRQRARWLQSHIIPAFWDEQNKLLLAATLRCRQPDIWGSAYAIAIGAIDDNYATPIRQALLENLDHIVRWGQIRHTLSPTWTHLLNEERDYRNTPTGQVVQQILPGSYQNGAFWATPTGWFATAVAPLDKGKAKEILVECIEYFKQNGIYECIDVDEIAGRQGRGRVVDYVVSITNLLYAKDHPALLPS